MHHKKGEHHAHKVTETHHKTVEDKLVENLIELQKVHADLAEKFNKLSNQIASLLTLFEMSARSIANSPIGGATEKDKAFLDKIDKLLDQNKLIAKGLTLMEGRMKEKVYGSSSTPSISQSTSQSMSGMNQVDDSEEAREMTPSIKIPEVPRPLPKY